MNDPVFRPSENCFELGSHGSSHPRGVVPSLNHSGTLVGNFFPFVPRGASLAFGREYDHFSDLWAPNRLQVSPCFPGLANAPHMSCDCSRIQEVKQPTRKRVLRMTMFPHVHNGETSRVLGGMDLGRLLSNQQNLHVSRRHSHPACLRLHESKYHHMYICRDHRPHGANRLLDENEVLYPCRNRKWHGLTLRCFCTVRQNFSIGCSPLCERRLQPAYSCTSQYLHPCLTLNACVCHESALLQKVGSTRMSKVNERGRHLAAFVGCCCIRKRTNSSLSAGCGCDLNTPIPTLR